MVATSELLSSAILRTIPASETKIIINHLGEGGMGAMGAAPKIPRGCPHCPHAPLTPEFLFESRADVKIGGWMSGMHLFRPLARRVFRHWDLFNRGPGWLHRRVQTVATLRR